MTDTLARVSRLAVVFSMFALPAGAAPPDEAITLTASREGFRPGTLKARPGDTVRLQLESADGEHCFALDALRVEKRIVPGRTTSVDLTPDTAGRFPFYCCLEGPDSVERGTLVVGE
jgi:heme/copper-type cytochrome/quinol oxidase subunit 2